MHEMPIILLQESPEELPIFPVIEYETAFDNFDKKPDFIDNTIIHCRYEFGPNDARQVFYLRSPIGEHRFILRLASSGYDDGDYSLQSEIEGYGFAIANLNEDEREQLFKTRAGFVESISAYTEEIKTIESSTHGNPYTIADIENCIAKLIEHPKNRESADVLRHYAADYVINRIFEKYEELFGDSYFGEAKQQNKAIARKKLFEAKFRKYLKTWEVIDTPFSTIYQLKRK